MKPIKLKLSGLNSFIEPVDIDFELLTQRNIFGIFGPTGSGKSTILDAMTLALYGDIPRDTKNFINANSKAAVVSFDFQISGKENRLYRVEREFRRDSNGQNARTYKARLVDLDQDIVLEDKATAVNQLCSEIVGLSKDDFSRTVVLPQGKFSEFLKLEGSKKREMLERLFNLQQYGDDLILKVNKQAGELRSLKDNLEGNLTSYGDLSEGDKEILVEEIKNDEATAKVIAEEVIAGETKFDALKAQWEKQLELEKKNQEKQRLEADGESYIQLERSIEKAQQARLHMPYIRNYENNLQEKFNLEKEIETSVKERKQVEQRSLELGLRQKSLEEDSLEKQGAVKRQELALSQLSINIEGRNNLQELEKLKERILNGEEKIKEEEIQKTQWENQLKSYEKEQEILSSKLREGEKQLEAIDQRLLNLEKEKDEVQRSQLLSTLTKDLNQGDSCPICGSTIHEFVEKGNNLQLCQLEEEQKQLKVERLSREKNLKNLNGEIEKLKGSGQSLAITLEKNKETIEKYNKLLENIKVDYGKFLNLAAKALDYGDAVETWDVASTLREINEKEAQKASGEKQLSTLRLIYEKAEKLCKDAKDEMQNSILERTRLETRVTELKKNLNSIVLKLEKSRNEIEESTKCKLSEVDLETIKQNFIAGDLLENMELDLANYKKQLEQLEGVIKNLSAQIASPIEAKVYEDALEALNQVKSKLEQTREKILINKEKLEQLNQKLEKQKKVRTELDKVSHKLGLVEELKKLFSGKRFVSYVARNQLIYIAREASKRLMDITGGSYEIMVDEDEKFQIIDYKNGATTREVASLSGGEVFITSFALALALASHIQLKGANLELFFLDEGFGTLDEELLEVVMTSIEKIKSDKLAIGLISHVESIKQRVPMKLIISPAESGGIGSKAKIEY